MDLKNFPLSLSLSCYLTNLFPLSQNTKITQNYNFSSSSPPSYHPLQITLPPPSTLLHHVGGTPHQKPLIPTFLPLLFFHCYRLPHSKHFKHSHIHNHHYFLLRKPPFIHNKPGASPTLPLQISTYHQRHHKLSVTLTKWQPY